MLRIVIDGIEAVVDNRTQIDFIRKTQFFWLRESRSFVYNHTLPKCPINDQIFEFSRKLHKKHLNTIIKPVRYYYNTLLVFSGIIKLKRATNEGYEVYSGLDDSDFYSNIKDKSLRDFRYGGKYYFAAKTWKDWLIEIIMNGTDTEFDVYHVFPVENKWLRDGAGSNYNLNAHFQNNFAAVIGPNGLGVPPDLDIVYPNLHMLSLPDADGLWGWPLRISPFLKLNWVLEKLMAEIGYTITYNFFNNIPEFKKMVIYHNRDLSADFDINSTEFMMNPYYLLPDIKVEEFIRSIEVTYGVSFWFRSDNKTLEIRPVVLEFDSAPVVEFSDMVTERYEIEIEDSQKKPVGIKMDVTNLNRLAVPDRMPNPPVLITEVANTSSVSSPVVGQVVLVTGDGYYIYSQTNDDPITFGWIKYLPDSNGDACNYFDSYYLTEDTEILESKLSFPMQLNPSILWHVLGQFNNRVSVPHVDCKIQRSSFQEENEFGFQMMIYEGLAVANPAGRSTLETAFAAERIYPWGRVDLINANNNIYTGSVISLRLNNDHQVPGTGLVDRFLKPYFETITQETKTIRRWKKLSPEQLHNLDFKLKYRIDQAEYFLISVTVQLTMEKITLAEMDMIKM